MNVANHDRATLVQQGLSFVESIADPEQRRRITDALDRALTLADEPARLRSVLLTVCQDLLDAPCGHGDALLACLAEAMNRCFDEADASLAELPAPTASSVVPPARSVRSTRESKGTPASVPA